MSEQPEIFNIDQLADYLKVPRSTLYKLVREGGIPSHKVGRQWRFRKETIHLWMDNRLPDGGRILNQLAGEAILP